MSVEVGVEVLGWCYGPRAARLKGLSKQGHLWGFSWRFLFMGPRRELCHTRISSWNVGEKSLEVGVEVLGWCYVPRAARQNGLSKWGHLWGFLGDFSSWNPEPSHAISEYQVGMSVRCLLRSALRYLVGATVRALQG